MQKALNCLSCSGCEGEQWQRGLERGPDPTAADWGREASSTVLTRSLVVSCVVKGEPAVLVLCLVFAFPGPWEEQGRCSAGRQVQGWELLQWFPPGRQNRKCKAMWFQHPWEAASWNHCVSSIILSFYIANQIETLATTEGKWDGGRSLRLAEEGTYQKAHIPFSKTAETEESLEHSRRYR